MNTAHLSPPPRLARPVRRLATAALFGALVPAVALAQGGAPPAKDSAAAAATTRTESGKRSRLRSFGKAAISKANSAANKVEEKTGVSKETIAKAALATTGVGAAAMLAKPDSGSLTSRVAATAGRTMIQKVEDARAGRNGAKVGATPEAPGGPTGGIPAGAMTAQQMALYRQQMAIAQAQAAAAQQSGGAMAGYAGAGYSAEMQRLQAEYTQIAMRASAGDKTAAQQMMRFSQEWSSAAMRLQTVAPAQQQAAYEAAMRDALRCATTGKDCRAGGQ